MGINMAKDDRGVTLECFDFSDNTTKPIGTLRKFSMSAMKYAIAKFQGCRAKDIRLVDMPQDENGDLAKGQAHLIPSGTPLDVYLKILVAAIVLQPSGSSSSCV